MKSYIHLDDKTMWPVPLGMVDGDVEIAELLNCYHAETATLTRQQAWRLREIVGAYDHLTTHPAGTGESVKKVRMLRRKLREVT